MQDVSLTSFHRAYPIIVAVYAQSKPATQCA
jgi:hypothetical protein